MTDATQVLIVGAGPVGLMLAVELQRRGVDVQLVERQPTPSYFVKALGITPRTLEIWDQLGLLHTMCDAGLFMSGNLTLSNGEVVAEQTFPEGMLPYGFLALAQYDAERLLRAHLQGLGGTVRWGESLTGFRDDGEAVTARLRGADGGERELRCGWLVGCDGAHSPVRHGLGLDYSGDALPMTFMLGDVALDWSLPRDRSCRLLEVADGTMTNQMVAIPIPGDPRRYRLSMAAPPEYWSDGADLATPPSLDVLARSAAPMLPAGATISDLRWSSFYRISHRIVPRYAVGRVFLAGDAAHIHPPIGGQGMNTGLQDAFNLGWKLALAAAGRAAPGLLDSYDAERRPVGLEVVTRTTRRMEQAVEGVDRGESVEQLRADAQLDVSYRDSTWVGSGGTPPAGGPQAGDRAPDVTGLQRPWIAAPVRLLELLRHPGHTVLRYLGTPDAGRVAALAGVLPADLIRTGVITAPGVPAPDIESCSHLIDAGNRFRDAYAPADGALLWIRPDGHIAWRSETPDAAALAAHAARIFAG